MPTMSDRRSATWRQSALAVALAALFTFAWAVRDWADLSALRLPDTDDAMRLQQVRDWLAGQAFGDLSQRRLAAGPPGGLAMHWSRLPDLVPGGLIAALTPLVGRNAAEVAAVIAWPGLLFAAALTLVAGIARAMLVPAPTALLVAALAFPATGLFLPGRIDHHGLQLVLLLALVRAMLLPRGAASGIAVGLAMVSALLIGLETAPFVALAAGLVVLGWVAGRAGAQAQLAALGATLAAGLAAGAALFAPRAWDWPGCDGFTAELWRAGLIGSAALLVSAAAGTVVSARRGRLAVALGGGALAGLAVGWISPRCLDPYGGVDPALAARWLANVGEAQPLFAASVPTVIAQCGLMLAGIVAGGVALWRTRDPGWAILLLFQLVAAGIAVAQLRGAWAGALLAAPALAWLIGAARRRGTAATVAAWCGSAGILYPLAAQLVSRDAPAAADAAPAACTGRAALAALDRLPAGLVAGPIDLGAWGLAATRHQFLAAPYHRNNAGNAAAFAISDGPAPVAAPLLARWRVDYIAACGAPPAWLDGVRPVLRHDALTVYRVADLPGAGQAP